MTKHRNTRSRRMGRNRARNGSVTAGGLGHSGQATGFIQAPGRGRRKGDEAKVTLARRLRQEATMSLKRIAQRLQMGSWAYVFKLLNEKSQTESLCK